MAEEDLTLPDLPPHVLDKIFKCISDKDLYGIRIVCKKWNEIIKVSHPKLREQAWITNINYEHELNILKSNPHCKEVIFMSFTEQVRLPLQDAFGSLQTIGFFGEIRNQDLITVLFNTPQLEALWFEENVFPDNMLTGSLRYIHLSNLKQMSIRCASRRGSYFSAAFTLDEEKLLSFVSKLSYGNLQTFECLFNNKILDNMDIAPLFIESAKVQHHLFKFILKHKQTLEMVELGEPARPLRLRLATDVNGVDGRPLQLATIVGFYDIPETFDIMFRVQYNLQAMKLNNAVNLLWFIRFALYQSSETITRLHLAGSGRYGRYDFSVISSCINLQDLKLMFSDCCLTPFPKLPDTLQKLYLSGPITDPVLNYITANLRDLDTFTLEDNLPTIAFSDVIVSKIDTKVVERFMLLPCLTTLSFFHCSVFDIGAIVKWCNQYDNVKAETSVNIIRQCTRLVVERYFP